jgi:replication initiation and membrane attachment protein DnaB
MLHSPPFQPPFSNNLEKLKTLIERTGYLVMKLSAHALRALENLDETSKQAVEQMVRAHVHACRLNGFQPENLERVYQEAIEIVRLEGPPKKDSVHSVSKYEPTRRYEQYRSPRAL